MHLNKKKTKREISEKWVEAWQWAGGSVDNKNSKLLSKPPTDGTVPAEGFSRNKLGLKYTPDKWSVLVLTTNNTTTTTTTSRSLYASSYHATPRGAPHITHLSLAHATHLLAPPFYPLSF